MCGIYGMVFHSNQHNKEPYRARLLFSSLAERAVVRGKDAAGLAVINPNNEIALYKNAVAATQIVKFRRWWRELRKIGSGTLAIMGHTRLGTHGENIIANAHPFRFGNVVGTHNGVVSNYKVFGPEKPFECDSANVVYGLSTLAKTHWKDLIEAIEGSFALAFSDNEGFYLVRNSSSPCHLAYIRELDATVYASTDTILKQAAADCSLQLEREEELPVGVLRTFSYTDGQVTDEKVDVRSRYSYTPRNVYSPMGWGDEEGHWPVPHTKLLPAVSEACSWEQAQPFDCGYCRQELSGKRYWDDQLSDTVCPDCYEKQLNMLFNESESESAAGVCDLCRKEAVVYPLGTTGQACNECMHDFDKDTPQDEFVVYCEACNVEFVLNTKEPPKNLLYIPHWDVYMCEECNELYAGIDR